MFFRSWGRFTAKPKKMAERKSNGMIATMFQTDKDGKPFVDKKGTRYFRGQTQSSWLKFYPPTEEKEAFLIINSKNYI